MIERKTFIEFNTAKEPSIQYLLGILEDARTTTMQRVAGLSTEELHWQYTPEWNSIGVLLTHIYSCEHLFRIQFIEQRELTAAENERWMPGCNLGKYVPQLITNQPIDFYIAELEKSRMSLIGKINELDKTEFYKKHDGYNIKTGYNLAWVLYHLAEDEVHHRGQISILRKLYSVKSAK